MHVFRLRYKHRVDGKDRKLTASVLIFKKEKEFDVSFLYICPEK